MRWNVFKAIRYRPVNTTFDQILARLHELNYRAAIIGPEGSGKTTLLEDLQQMLQEKGIRTNLIFVNDTSPLRQSGVPAASVGTDAGPASSCSTGPT